MKSNNKNKLFLNLLILLSIFAAISCERDVPSKLTSVDCLDDCYDYRPDSGKLIVKLTINDENPFVPLIVYKGNIEGNIIEYPDTSYSTDYWVRVPVNDYYSIIAEYKSGNKTIYVVDGDDFKIKYTQNDCDFPCYYYYGGYYDIQLRN